MRGSSTSTFLLRRCRSSHVHVCEPGMQGPFISLQPRQDDCSGLTESSASMSSLLPSSLFRQHSQVIWHWHLQMSPWRHQGRHVT